jgi:L-amino acid N-acyltransferase YncA
VIVRRATVDDAAAIADVQSRTWLDAYAGIVAREKLVERIAGREDVWRKRLGDGLLMWVAQDARGVVGIASAGRSRDASAADDVGEVQMIYVAPEAQGAGAGRALLDRAVTQLRDEGFASATLWVFEANTAGRGFYEHLGWALEDGEVHEDLWAPEVRYRRTL